MKTEHNDCELFRELILSHADQMMERAYQKFQTDPDGAKTVAVICTGLQIAFELGLLTGMAMEKQE